MGAGRRTMRDQASEKGYERRREGVYVLDKIRDANAYLFIVSAAG